MIHLERFEDFSQNEGLNKVKKALIYTAMAGSLAGCDPKPSDIPDHKKTFQKNLIDYKKKEMADDEIKKDKEENDEKNYLDSISNYERSPEGRKQRKKDSLSQIGKP